MTHRYVRRKERRFFCVCVCKQLSARKERFVYFDFDRWFLFLENRRLFRETSYLAEDSTATSKRKTNANARSASRSGFYIGGAAFDKRSIRTAVADYRRLFICRTTRLAGNPYLYTYQVFCNSRIRLQPPSVPFSHTSTTLFRFCAAFIRIRS